MNYHAMQILKSCGLTAAFAASAVAQGPATPSSPNQPDLRSVVSQSFGMDFVDGMLRAGGPGYMAHFDRDGMEYTPVLGEAAPRNLPVRFRLKSIRRGQNVLFEAAAGNAVAPRQQGMIASYDRGDGVVETYEARVDGVKQNFTFQNVPMGSGDLVVECELQTELQTVRGSSDQGFSVEMPGIGGVTIGQVVGVDAFGSRVPGSMSCDGATLQLVLPDAFVTQAAYPMVLDPIIGTLTPFNAPIPSTYINPAVAFDETFDNYLVVWQEQVSSMFAYLRSARVDTAGNLVGGCQLLGGSQVNIRPAVGHLDNGSNYLVCWQAGPTMFGPWHLQAQRVPADPAGSCSAVVDVTTPGDNSQAPDVSCENGPAAGATNNCVIVYERDVSQVACTLNSVSAIQFDVSTMAATGVEATICGGGGPALNPSISKGTGDNERYLIVWEEIGFIKCKLFDHNLALISQAPLTSLIFQDKTNPQVAGSGDSWVITYQVAESSTSSVADIYCSKLEWDGASWNQPAFDIPIATNPGQDEREPAIGYMADASGAKYVVAWASQGAGLNYDMRMLELDAGNCTVCGQEQIGLGGIANGNNVKAAIATRWSGRASNTAEVDRDQAMVAWMQAMVLPTPTSDIVCNLYEAFGGGAVTNLGGGCGQGGVNTTNGPCALGNSTFELRLNNAGSSLNLLSIRFANTTVSCGACDIQGNGSSFQFVAGAGGDASRTLPIPCDPAFVGADLYTQWASLFSGSNPCPLTPGLGLSFSNRIQATIAP